MAEGMSRVVVGRYRLVRSLGRGGMGAVWHAHDTLLGRDVAIKEIWFPSAGNGPVDPADPLIRRALREAQAAARLRHPGIVTVYDVVTDEGRPWIVMELINGRSLAEAIREHGLLTEQRTAEIGLQVLDALRAAHRAGIAHRDVKPANILLDDADRVVLTDFGIAAIDDATALTATGQMVGSPAYLAPERINGQPATAAGDLWALGVTLYTTVTGRSPFQREDTQTTFAAILTSRPTPPAHAGRLWPVVKGLLIKDPARRLGTEQAHKLLANVAAPQPGRAALGGEAARWWPLRSKGRKPALDGLPGTVAAPPPTLAATTAYQDQAPADTVAAETAGVAALQLIPIATPPLSGAQAVTTVPLAPYPEAARRPRKVWAWTAVGIVSVLLVAAGLFYTNIANREQQRLALQQRIADRFTAAADQLGQEGDDNLPTRLAGIYALQRLMRDSPPDESAIVGMLSAFIRIHARMPAAIPERIAPQSPEDVRAAVTVIGNRPDPASTPIPDFSTTRLGLGGVDLHGTDLSGTNLVQAGLGKADLRGANLSGANLLVADLHGANFSGANLSGAILNGTDLSGANLRGTDLRDTKLGAGALLSGADLSGALNLRLSQLAEAQVDKDTTLPDGSGALRQGVGRPAGG